MRQRCTAVMHSVEIVQRYSRGARWLHAVVYVGILIDLGTGWWFILADYRESPVARLTGIGDQFAHEYAGLALIPVVLTGMLAGRRGMRTFAAESVRFNRADLAWFRRWPRAVVSGRFPHHDGHFDPGQRLANLVMAATLASLLVTGVGALYVGGPLGQVAYQAHRWSAFLVTPVLLGHIVIAAGVLPGYRGVWRSMHLGGWLPAEVAGRIWPAWLDRERSR
jgi:cytochrome b subunit of formate dehydrogenase